MATITKAAIEAQRNTLIQNVVDYSGCDEGKIQFLRDSGIPDDVISKFITIPVATPDLVAVTVVFRPDEGVTPMQVSDAVQELLDNNAMVRGASTYVAAIAAVDTEEWNVENETLQENFWAESWMNLDSWATINTVSWETPISVFDA